MIGVYAGFVGEPGRARAVMCEGAAALREQIEVGSSGEAAGERSGYLESMVNEPPSAPKSPSPKAVRIFPLGHEPREDLCADTTAEERLAILRRLTERAWALSGRSLPAYSRPEIPVRIVRLQ